MATPEDMKANAEFIRQADEVVDVPGGANNNNYANINLICQIAERLRVDAVMPMWGHASENPLLPSSLLKIKHRVTFIGPPAEPMHALGDKIGSTIIAQSAGVPVIGWNGDDIRIDYKKDGLSDETYAMANVTTGEDALKCANRIGYPVMIKASEGGGGKGIRKCLKPETVLDLFRQVQAEIPGSPIFVMRMATKARHLEVQLIADKYGEAIALSGRDCSVQRRHQKIIEEGPPTAAPIEVFKRMEKAAVALAKAVGYCNAGTVEYLYMEETQDFAFLELNPRLQVEHPVTENIMGLNLPSIQLQVAMGLPLHRIRDIRKMYGRNGAGTDTIDYDFSERQVPPRHCIAIRITAENPDASFQPTSGSIQELKFLSAIDVWGYFSIDSSGSIHEFADSQFGHIFASGPDRESARRACLVALKELQIRGDIRTTTEYIIKLLQSDDFMNNKIDTDWLDGRIARASQLAIEENAKYCPPPVLVAACGAALQGYSYFDNRDKEYMDSMNMGQVPPLETLSAKVNVDLIFNNIKYCTTVVQDGPTCVNITCNGECQNVQVREIADGGYLVGTAGKSHLAYLNEEPNGSVRMILDGHTCIFTPEYDPTKLASSVAGKLARHLVPDGSHVEKGEAYCEVEVMKMYMPLKAEEAGVVSFQMSEGATLSPGDEIATMVLDEPDKVVKAEVYTKSLQIKADGILSVDEQDMKPHLRLRNALLAISNIMEGYPKSENNIDNMVTDLITSINSKETPYLNMGEVLSVLRGRIDANLWNAIDGLNSTYYESASSNNDIEYPAASIMEKIQAFASSLPNGQKTGFQVVIAPVWAAAEPYLYNGDVRVLGHFKLIIERYLEVESLFDKLSFTDVVTELRRNGGKDLPTILQMCRSHGNLSVKNALVVRLLDEMKNLPLNNKSPPPKLPTGVFIREEINIRQLKLRLTDLAKLRQNVYSHVSFTTNLLLMEQYAVKPEQRRQRLEEAVVASLNSDGEIGSEDRVMRMKKFIESNIVIRDLLFNALQHDKDYRIAVMEIYLRKVYQKTHDLNQFTCGHSLGDGSIEISSWIRFEFTTRAVDAIETTGARSLGDTDRCSYNDLVELRQRSGSLTGGSPGRSSANQSTDSLSESSGFIPGHSGITGSRVGVFGILESFDQLPSLFPSLLAKIPEGAGVDKSCVNVIHVILMKGLMGGAAFDDDCAGLIGGFLSSQKDALKARRVRRVTFLVGEPEEVVLESFGSVFTFRAKTDFSEDRLFRHIEAPHAFHLDLPQLSNYSLALETGVSTTSGNVHIYKALPISVKGPCRFFARLVSFTSDVNNSDAETLFVEALDSLGLCIGKEEAVNPDFRKRSAANHVFLNVVAPDQVIAPEQYEAELRRICTKYWYKMVRLSISSVEMKLTGRIATDTAPCRIRLLASNPTGFVLKIDNYYESQENGDVVFRTVKGALKGPLDGMSTATPYAVSEKFEQQRAYAMASSDTLYAYDWPMLFEAEAENQWNSYLEKRSSQLPPIEFDKTREAFVCQELVLCSKVTDKPYEGKSWSAQDAETNGFCRPMMIAPGLNTCGMVAWLMRFRTPEYPDGRELVVICNDITKEAGSFGTKEDIMFFKASEYARVRGLPRLYLAANSGARIGMAQSLKALFKVCWNEDQDPAKGFQYIYLEKDDYDTMVAKYKDSKENMPLQGKLNDAGQFVITDIIGEEPDLGVENLMGSGLIAGETARAYDDIFTLTCVVGRTVGIGAYLVRLGQRTIQRTRNSPIILTGYQALNKLMGRNIYTSNDQLGGPMIMFPNGVSHMLAETHLESISHALQWLSYVPSVKDGHLPLRDLGGVDTVERDVDFTPTKGTTYDPRMLCCGIGEGDNWTSGFFDKDSFVETLAGWAKTVVVGRARLGGIPMGVILTENRTAEALKPADPADASSAEKMVQQAGGVWFPDSAYKTAQALRDFNREKLPCIIFANWRGFSGGQRDMFDEVLKFGSMIVDALVAYQQPLFVYIPPFAELRGGAWVVVDHTINADVMEFYAAEDARGGVLEATGAASIKFREKDIIATAHRLDNALISLDEKLTNAKNTGNDKEVALTTKEIKKREKMVLGVYHQVSSISYFIHWFILMPLIVLIIQ